MDDTQKTAAFRKLLFDTEKLLRKPTRRVMKLLEPFDESQKPEDDGGFANRKDQIRYNACQVIELDHLKEKLLKEGDESRGFFNLYRAVVANAIFSVFYMPGYANSTDIFMEFEPSDIKNDRAFSRKAKELLKTLTVPISGPIANANGESHDKAESRRASIAVLLTIPVRPLLPVLLSLVLLSLRQLFKPTVQWTAQVCTLIYNEPRENIRIASDCWRDLSLEEAEEPLRGFMLKHTDKQKKSWLEIIKFSLMREHGPQSITQFLQSLETLEIEFKEAIKDHNVNPYHKAYEMAAVVYKNPLLRRD